MSLDVSVASRACYPLILMLVETAPGAEGNQMLLKGDSRLGPGVGRNQRLEPAEPNVVEEGFQVAQAIDLMRVSRFLPPGDRSHLFYGAHSRNRWWSSRYAAGRMELRYALMIMECPCRFAGYRGLGQPLIGEGLLGVKYCLGGCRIRELWSWMFSLLDGRPPFLL
ncbi:hypothetical protein DY000_02053572 [Brassica cretica]|uniref:Uncharacterized protein n=1 Tax=Brassica cretica TaxID=69181 RepID=A0ABQ7A563_BRACR|nr:hypothetical protein DY000_02053572 [Brassica cretica]